MQRKRTINIVANAQKYKRIPKYRSNALAQINVMLSIDFYDKAEIEKKYINSEFNVYQPKEYMR
jgi:hypothetical protein